MILVAFSETTPSFLHKAFRKLQQSWEIASREGVTYLYFATLY